jgi:hypothetical protein
MAAFRRSWTLASVGLTSLALLGLRSYTDALSAQQSGRTHSTPDLLSGGFIEAMCETLIALAMAATISIGLISLSAHLNEAKTLRQVDASPMQSTAERRLPSIANVGPAETASHYN